MAILKVSDRDSEIIEMADFLPALWSAIRRGYAVYLENEPDGELPGTLLLVSPQRIERDRRKVMAQGADALFSFVLGKAGK